MVTKDWPFPGFPVAGGAVQSHIGALSAMGTLIPGSSNLSVRQVLVTVKGVQYVVLVHSGDMEGPGPLTSPTDQPIVPLMDTAATLDHEVHAAELTRPIDSVVSRFALQVSEASLALDGDAQIESAWAELLAAYGVDALVAASVEFETGNISPYGVAAALRTLGLVGPRFLAHAPLEWALQRSLRHISPVVRDGALVGIMNLDVPGCVPILKRALESERDDWLKKELLDAIAHAR